MYSTLQHIGLESSALISLHYNKKATISGKYYQHESSPQALKSLQLKFNHKHNTRDPNTATNGPHSTTTNTDSNNKNIYIVVPYIRGLSEKFRTSATKVGIQVHCKGHNTINILLIAPKDKDNMYQKRGVIYHYNAHTWEWS